MFFFVEHAVQSSARRRMYGMWWSFMNGTENVKGRRRDMGGEGNAWQSLAAFAHDENDFVAQGLGEFYATELQGAYPSGHVFGP